MTASPLDWEDPRTVLRRHDLWAKRAFSQNFLIARPVVERIAAQAHALDAGVIVELGPGLGTLTKALLASGSKVHAVERDRDMIAVLQTELKDVPSFVVCEADAAKLDFHALSQTLGSPITAVGNLPYAITGAIMRTVVEAADVVPAAVFMVQREVRDRMQALPATSEYGALTVFTNVRYAVSTLTHVGRNCFHPPPKITSSVIVLSRLATPRAQLTPRFQQVVRASFETRRKTLRNALLNARPGDQLTIDAALQAADIDGKRRGETLSVEEFDRLAQAIDAVSART
jgi:16S rRNA (adenine1518-N6/adenine1519-N6)-dimethyltransferase